MTISLWIFKDTGDDSSKTRHRQQDVDRLKNENEALKVINLDFYLIFYKIFHLILGKT